MNTIRLYLELIGSRSANGATSMLVDSTFDNVSGQRDAELAGRSGVETGVVVAPGRATAVNAACDFVPALHLLSSRSLPLRLAAILGRLFSSLLPPSFARGRFATFFFVAAGALAPASLPSALTARSLA